MSMKMILLDTLMLHVSKKKYCKYILSPNTKKKENMKLFRLNKIFTFFFNLLFLNNYASKHKKLN